MNESIEELLASGAVVPDRPGSKRLVPAAQSVVVPVDGQSFSSEQDWINRASRVLTRHPEYNNTEHGEAKGWRGPHFTALCFDQAGNRMRCGGDFKRATEEATYPVWWVWPDQIAAMLAAAPAPSSLAGGEVSRQTIINAVKVAMNDAWCDITSDTDCWPADLKRVSQRGPMRLEYRPAIWTDTTAEMATNAILAALSPEAPAREAEGLEKANFPPRTHVPQHEGSAWNQMPKGGWRDLQLHRYDGTDLFQWFGKKGENSDARDWSVFEDSASEVFMMRSQAALTPRHEAPADQTERWAKALYDNNAFYTPDPDDGGWSDMAPNDGGIHDLHMDMARAAKSVWDRADEAPAEGAGELIQRIVGNCGGFVPKGEDLRLCVEALEDAFRARSSAPEAREGDAKP